MADRSQIKVKHWVSFDDGEDVFYGFVQKIFKNGNAKVDVKQLRDVDGYQDVSFSKSVPIKDLTIRQSFF